MAKHIDLDLTDILEESKQESTLKAADIGRYEELTDEEKEQVQKAIKEIKERTQEYLKESGITETVENIKEALGKAVSEMFFKDNSAFAELVERTKQLRQSLYEIEREYVIEMFNRSNGVIESAEIYFNDRTAEDIEEIAAFIETEHEDTTAFERACISLDHELHTELAAATIIGTGIQPLIDYVNARYNELGLNYTYDADAVLDYLQNQESSKYLYSKALIEELLTAEVISIPAETTALKVNYQKPNFLIQDVTRAGQRIFDRNIPAVSKLQTSIDIIDNKPYYTLIDLEIDDNLKYSKNLTQFDHAVFDAVISMTRTNQFFTAKEVTTFLTHGNRAGGSNESGQKVAAVTKSIEKMMDAKIKVDWTGHAELNKMTGDKLSFTHGGYVLPLETYEITINGKTVKGYKLISNEPPLFKYAKSVKQLNTVSAELLNVPVNLNDAKIVMRGYLLKQISHYKNPKGKIKNNILTFDTIYDYAGINTTDRNQRKRNKETVLGMLDYWKEQKHIKGYKVHKKGRADYSVEIKV